MIDLKKYFLSEDSSDVLNFELDLSGLELDGVKPFCAPVSVRAEIRSFAGSAQLSAHVRYTLVKPCDRCLKLVSRDYDRNFDHMLVRELSDEQDDDAYVVVPDEQLDLDRLLEEDILLDMPLKFLCSENCKGLCPKCGKDLNEGDCGCDRREIDPRLAALQALLEPEE